MGQELRLQLNQQLVQTLMLQLKQRLQKELSKTIGPFEKQVIEKLGVEPKKVVQIQALMGDKVDNIPGAPGIGPKTALELINKYFILQ